jgi:hypothetical protein
MHKRPQLAAAFAAGILLWTVATPRAAEHAMLFQVFLNDGTKIVSSGEYARVGDRIIFSMPIGALTAEPQLHVVNLPATAVDWESTARYADSIRFSHYAVTRAEGDYAALTARVADVLNAIALNTEPRVRLNLATELRRELVAWPRAHYGYRSRDVQQMLGFLDEAISEMRAAVGDTAFSVDLIAAVEPPPVVPRLADPTPEESIAQAFAVARLTDVTAERISLLKAIVQALDNPTNVIPAATVKVLRKKALVTIEHEASLDREYLRLSAEMLRRATAAAARADVKGVEEVVAAVRRQDRELGARRPDEVQALITGLQAQLEAARRLRLLRDQWAERIRAYRVYQAAVAPVVETLERAEASLDDIKRLAGPEATVLGGLLNRFDSGEKLLTNVAVPDELKPAHALLLSALALAENAVQTRRAAVVTGSIPSAWDASSAAAGAMMLFARSRADTEAVIKLPQLR